MEVACCFVRGLGTRACLTDQDSIKPLYKNGNALPNHGIYKYAEEWVAPWVSNANGWRMLVAGRSAYLDNGHIFVRRGFSCTISRLYSYLFMQPPMRRMRICCTDIFLFFFLFFFVFSVRHKNTRQPFSETAERIFMKLLPNDSGENVVSNVVPKWGLGTQIILWGLKTTHCAIDGDAWRVTEN